MKAYTSGNIRLSLIHISDEETDQELAFIYVSYLRQKLKSVHSNLEILGDEAGPFQLTEKAGEDHVS